MKSWCGVLCTTCISSSLGWRFGLAVQCNCRWAWLKVSFAWGAVTSRLGEAAASVPQPPEAPPPLPPPMPAGQQPPLPEEEPPVTEGSALGRTGSGVSMDIEG
eukprot:scaffold648765_cov51-Prasinocladus_malaysianus.AAC.1